MGTRRGAADETFDKFARSQRRPDEIRWAMLLRAFALTGRRTAGIVVTDQRVLFVDYTFVREGHWRRKVGHPTLRSSHRREDVTVTCFMEGGGCGGSSGVSKLDLAVNGTPLRFRSGGWLRSPQNFFSGITAALGGYEAAGPWARFWGAERSVAPFPPEARRDTIAGGERAT
jgi:hypothetical protein